MSRVRVLAPYFAPAVNGGGPIRTLAALTRTAPDGMAIDVVTRDRDLGVPTRLDVPCSALVEGDRRVRFIDSRGPLGLLRLAAAFVSGPRPDLTYCNSVFDTRFGVLPVVLRRCGAWRSATMLVAPRGEFDRGALAIKATKKRRYLRLARALGLFRGVVWHASTELEAVAIRAAVGTDVDVVVRENETSLPRTATLHPVPAVDRLELVTVGRVSPKKRVHLLIEALADVARPVRLVVVGPVDDAAYGRRCATAADALPSHVQVEFRGTQSHEGVLDSIRAAHAMVTATAGENFGHTIAETLSVGRPVLLSDTTPWSARAVAGGGEVVADDAWAATIDRWAGRTAAELGDRSRCAARAYDAWRSGEQAPHVFELAIRHP